MTMTHPVRSNLKRYALALGIGGMLLMSSASAWATSCHVYQYYANTYKNAETHKYLFVPCAEDERPIGCAVEMKDDEGRIAENWGAVSEFSFKKKRYNHKDYYGCEVHAHNSKPYFGHDVRTCNGGPCSDDHDNFFSWTLKATVSCMPKDCVEGEYEAQWYERDEYTVEYDF